MAVIGVSSALLAANCKAGDDLDYWISCSAGYPFSEGLSRLYGSLREVEIANNKNKTEILGRYAFIDKSGNFAIPFIFEQADDFHEGLASVAVRSKNGDLLYGYIDHQGKYAIQLKFEDAKGFSEGLAPVKSKGKWGYIDRKGRVVINFKYSSADSFSDGTAAVHGIDSLDWGYIDLTGSVVLPFIQRENWSFKEGLVPSSFFDGRRSKPTLMDRMGRHVVELKEGSALGDFSEGLVKVNGGYSKEADRSLMGFADSRGEIVVPLVFEGLYEFGEGLAAARKGGKWGFIDKRGNVKIPFEYRLDESEFSEGRAVFSEGLAPVAGGYINMSGKFVIEFGSGHTLGNFTESEAKKMSR
jgi:hypothetical protein